MRHNKELVWILACVGTVAVGCGAEEPPPPPVSQVEAGPAAPAAGDPAMELQAVEPQQERVELQREVFSYGGSGRDPFISLLRSGDVRPLLEDLRVTSINYNPRYPSSSVAVLRDTTVGQRYTVRVGDEVGRLRIAEIRQTEVLVIIEEFGVERQRTLALRRRQEELP
ncbi:MAG: hypothetical protein JSW43_06340 [Gemmatimonadota bacterium]|nr:MAG: hypothetical protein JSW43_06340 [Gemmatimonadota bacterium]